MAKRTLSCALRRHVQAFDARHLLAQALWLGALLAGTLTRPRQVIGNLVSNALRHTAAGGSVTW